jgi:hypothetical protein
MTVLTLIGVASLHRGAQSRCLYPDFMAILTALPASPGAACHVPKPCGCEFMRLLWCMYITYHAGDGCTRVELERLCISGHSANQVLFVCSSNSNVRGLAASFLHYINAGLDKWGRFLRVSSMDLSRGERRGPFFWNTRSCAYGGTPEE